MGRSINMGGSKKGFTLIELIVVLAVLAIIMAIAVPSFAGVREEAKVDSDMATLASIAKLAEFEYVKKDLTPGVDLNFGVDSDVVENLIEGNFSAGKLFQSKDLEDVGADAVDVTFGINGKVATIIAGGKTYTYANGKVTP